MANINNDAYIEEQANKIILLKAMYLGTLIDNEIEFFKMNMHADNAPILKCAINELEKVKKVLNIKPKTNKEIKVKHWSGLLNFDNMQNPEWLDHWILKAKVSENENKDLVVFEIPKDGINSLNGEMIEQIELLIQSKCQ
jgi:hypothetical protein